MAELENEDIVEDVEDETTQNEEVEETQEETWEEETITWEQAMEWKKKAERLDKAEKALVEKKKAEKAQKKETKDTPITSRDEVKRLLAEEKFYDKNPEAEDYRKEIEKYQAKGLSLEDAYLLASKKDKEVEQRREVYWKWLIKWSQNVEWMSAISIDEFDRMTPQAQDEYTKKMTAKYWKVKFK